MREIAFHYTDTLPAFEINNYELHADYKVSTFFINSTGYDITVINRNNLPITIPKETGGYTSSGSIKSFVIRHVYYFQNNESIVKTINNINTINKHFPGEKKEISIIREVLLDNFNKNPRIRNIKVNIDHEINIDTLRDQRSLYIANDDILISIDSDGLSHPHPFSKEGQSLSYYRDIIDEKKVSGVLIEIVDNEDSIKSRYMFIAKQMMQIDPHRDSTKESGVYISFAVCNKFNDIFIEPRYMSFEQAEEELGLCKTKEEAMAANDPEMVMKNMLAEANLNLVNSKIQLEQYTQENKKLAATIEREQLENKSKLNILESELEATKKINMIQSEQLNNIKNIRSEVYDDIEHRRKDYYSQREHSRKDSSEYLKLGVGIITGVFGMFAYGKLKTK